MRFLMILESQGARMNPQPAPTVANMKLARLIHDRNLGLQYHSYHSIWYLLFTSNRWGEHTRTKDAQWPSAPWTPLRVVKWLQGSQGKSGNIHLWGLPTQLAMRLARNKELGEPLDGNAPRHSYGKEQGGCLYLLPIPIPRADCHFSPRGDLHEHDRERR